MKPCRPLSVVLLGLWGILLAPSPVSALVCTNEDIQSKNAERCAKKYTAALRKCIKKGIPLETCDTSKSDESCSQLSAGCDLRTKIDETVGLIYGDAPRFDECRHGLLNHATKFLSKRLARQRRGKSVKLPQDLSTCISKAAKKCDAVPMLADPCAEVQNLEEAATCVCNSESGCIDVSTQTFQALAAGGWAGTRDHAAGLGYTDPLEITQCTDVRGETVLVAILENPAQPGDTLAFLYDLGGAFSFLVRVGPNKSLTWFNEGGGLWVGGKRGKLKEVVGPDGLRVSETQGAAQVVPRGVSPPVPMIVREEAGGN